MRVSLVEYYCSRCRPMLSLYSNSPHSLFADLLPTTYKDKSVYVISDSEYKRYRQAQTLEEIAVLERRAKSYESTAASIRKTILELRAEADLPETTDGTTDVNVTE